jgi:hypothetical protein
MSDLVLTTRSASEFYLGRGAKWEKSASLSTTRRLLFSSLNKKGEAERRQTQIKPPRFPRGARSAERARLSAFHRGSHLRESFIPKARLQARLPGNAV